MTHYVAIVIQNGYRMYLSTRSPFSPHRHMRAACVAYIASEFAFQFKTREEALDSIAEYVKDKPYIGIAGVAEVNYYKVDHGAKSAKQKATS